jgi:hypothetical protein
VCQEKRAKKVRLRWYATKELVEIWCVQSNRHVAQSLRNLQLLSRPINSPPFIELCFMSNFACRETYDPVYTHTYLSKTQFNIIK